MYSPWSVQPPSVFTTYSSKQSSYPTETRYGYAERMKENRQPKNMLACQQQIHAEKAEVHVNGKYIQVQDIKRYMENERICYTADRRCHVRNRCKAKIMKMIMIMINIILSSLSRSFKGLLHQNSTYTSFPLHVRKIQ